MNPVLPALAVLLALSLSVGAEDALRVVKTAAAPDGIDFQRGEHGPTLARVLATATHGRPYVHPLRSPDGRGVLTEFSPGHHKHQTGLYWGPTRINGRDYFHHFDQSYWANTKLSHLFTFDAPGPPTIRATSDLLNEAGEAILNDEQRWSLVDHGSWYTLDFQWTGEALVDVTIGKYDYGGLFLRMPWKPGTPAEVINSEGHKNQEGEGQPAKWIDVAMQIEGMDEMAHLTIIDHPQNDGHPALWRIDGQFGVGPALARRRDITIPKGESKTVRYRLVVYQGEFNRELIDKEQAAFRGP